MLTIKNGVGWFWAACLGGLLLAGCMPPGPRVLLKGRDQLEKGKYADAIQSFRKATELLKTNAQAFNYLGLAYHHAGQATDAANAYLRALALDQDLSEARYNLGCLYLEENKLDQAKAEFTAYTLRRPKAVEGFINLGTVQLRRREVTAAEKSFEEALRLKANDPQAITGLGLANLQRGKAVEAAQSFRLALEKQADYGPALLNLAALEHQHFGNRAAALELYKRYLAIKPPPPDAGAIQGLAKQLEIALNIAKGSPARETGVPPVKAVQPETRAVAAGSRPETNVNRGNPPGKNELAQKEPVPTKPLPAKPAPPGEDKTKPEMAGTAPPSANAGVTPATEPKTAPNSRPVETVHLPERPAVQVAVDQPAVQEAKPVSPAETNAVAARDPNAVPKRSLLQKMNPLNLFSRDSKPQAVVALGSTNSEQRALDKPEANPTWPRYVYKSAGSLVKGNQAEAEKVFALAVKSHQAQNLKEAMQSYRKAIQLDPAFYKAYFNLGIAASEAGDTSAAMAAYESALAVKPDSTDARYNFALLLKQGNFFPDAINELEKVLAINPKESRADLALGNIYGQQLKETSKARSHYLRVLETDPRNPQADTIRLWLATHPQQ